MSTRPLNSSASVKDFPTAGEVTTHRPARWCLHCIVWAGLPAEWWEGKAIGTEVLELLQGLPLNMSPGRQVRQFWVLFKNCAYWGEKKKATNRNASCNCLKIFTWQCEWCMAFLSVWTAAPLSLFCFYWIICNKHCTQERPLVPWHSSFTKVIHVSCHIQLC